MNRILTLLTDRLGLFRTWGSFARVAGWVVVWCVVVGLVVSPAPPSASDPYSTDIGPRMISMRSMSATGIQSNW